MPAAQAILGMPFATSARVKPNGFQSVRLAAAGRNIVKDIQMLLLNQTQGSPAVLARRTVTSR